MKYVIRAIAIILTSPIWLAGIALALPVVIFGGVILGIAQLMTYAISGKWMD
jgi:fructose-specific phosphotransferase system IIC component